MADLISRQALLDVMNKEGIWGYFEQGWMEQEMEDIIKGLPSAEVSQAVVNDSQGLVKRGHWIGTEYGGYADGNPVYDAYECSECGAEFYGEDFDFEYCPRCGAKMEVENE